MSAVAGVAAAVGVAVASSGAAANTASTYVVLFKGTSVPTDAAKTIERAGGTLLYSYDEIGVAIASSTNSSFGDTLSKDNRVAGASSTAGFGTKLEADAAEVVNAASLTDGPVSDTDPLSPLQWDMVQIHTPEAHAITGGSRSVLVGDLDTGVDYTHPDLAANIDFENSTSCVGGVPNQDPAAWSDQFGHGTHTAGTIAAAANGVGIVGVAPNVRLAAIKVVDSNGFIYPEYAICGFIWAADHGVDVTNNSYFVDPWLFNCVSDPQQRAIWKAVQRAISYAMQRGVTVVASQGNENKDLSKRNTDTISPDDGAPLTREVTNACRVMPVEIPGVIGVTANGNLMQKSYYSSYGSGVVQVVAPGGDARFQRTTAAPNGQVLSTYPGNRYAYLQGTSMAAPHVTGVAALVISEHGKMPPGAVQALINRTSDPVSCPPNPFNPGPPFSYQAVCVGGNGYNGFYGHGQVDALTAITG